MFELDAHHLRQVLQIVRSGSLAQAARALNMAQPTLSRALQRIEDKLGVKLFDRGGGGLQPTVYGAHVARRAADALGEVNAITEEVLQLAAGLAGRVRIGAGPATMEGVMPLVVDRIVARYPRLGISLTRDLGPVLAERLAARELDIVVANRGGFHHPRLVEEALPPLTAVMVVRPGHPLLSRQGPFTFADILEFPLASPGLPSEPEEYSLRTVPEERRRNFNAYHSSEYSLLRRICRTSDAVAAGTIFTFREELEEGTLVRLPLAFATSIPGSLLSTAEALLNPAVNAACGMIRDIWRKERADARGEAEARAALAATP